jgi:hypothetical protein
MMSEEQMDQFEHDMIDEEANLIMENLRQSIIDEKLNELIVYYGLDSQPEQIFC